MANTKISALSSASTPLTGSEIVPINQSGVTDSVTVANLTAGRAVSAASLTTTGKVGVGVSPTYQLDVQGGANVTGSWYTTARFENSAATQGIHLGYNTSTTNSMVVAVEQGSGLELWTNNNAGGGWTSKFTVSANGDITFTTGNVIQGTAGKGINFTANTPKAGMTSQLLNWYEEGTWTPTLAASIGSITTSTITGTYTRSGNLVFVAIRVTIANNGTGLGSLNITGFPFAAKTATTISGATREDTAVGFGIVASPTSTTSINLTKYDGTYPGGSGYGFSLCLTYNM